MPDNYIEENRYLYLNTPLGPDKLILLTFNGFESMSEMFRFQLEVAAKKDDVIAFDKLIGQACSFGVKATDDDDPRHFDSICIEFSEGTRDVEFKYYTIVVAPKLWMLTQRRGCRIFQQKSVHDILTTVLTGFDTDFKLQGTYEPREFCVQYNETDFDFASRLMEEEGIAYYFKFAEGSHTMVLMDTPTGHQDVPGATTYTFDTAAGGNRFEDEERVASWRRIQSWSSAKYTLWDHNFQLTDKHLDAEKPMSPETVTGGTVTHKLKLNGNDAFEIYEYPGNYAKRFDGISSSGGEQASELNKIFSDYTRTVGIRMKQVATPDLLFSGGGNCRRFTAGHKFTLSEHYDADGQYVLTSVTHMAQEGDFRSNADVNVEHYENSFTCIPIALPYVPARKTPRPRVFGCQTAKVVGAPGEEIFTDKYGRVKVQFRWDREGQENTSSSCWLRVATPWAGKNWGMIHIPRIGQEVIVDFMEGDPDRPIVIGSVYNPDQMPPYKLPDNKTQSGLQSRSSKGGGAANCNEIKFEDKKGSEMVWIHAEKDHTGEVEHDETHWVGNDQTITVDNNRTELVKGVEKVNVKGDRHNKLEGNHFEEYAQQHSLKVGQNQNNKIGMNYGVDAGMCVSFKAGVNIVLEASVGITLKAGASSITISPAGIMISGTPLCLINTAAVALPGVPVVAIPPIIIPPVPAIPPIPGTSTTGPGATAAVTLAALPSIPPLPPLPPVAPLAAQVNSVVSSAADSAAQLVSGTAQLMDQSSTVAAQSLTQAQQAGTATAEGAADVQKQVDAAVADAKKNVQSAVDDSKKQVTDAVNEQNKEAQAALKKSAEEVKDKADKAAQDLQAAQQQAQQAANQAEQIAQQAAQQGQAALAQSAQQAQNAAQQAQQLAAQSEQQMHQLSEQAEQTAKNAEKQGQQELNAASQQLNATAAQAQQGAQQVQQQMQNATQQTQQMAQQAMQQGEQQMAQAGQQAQQAAQQGQQQAAQAASEAKQAADKAGTQAQQQTDQSIKSVDNAAKQAGKNVDAAAQQGQQQISSATQQATQKAVQDGKMAEQTAANVTNQVSNSASGAAGHVGQAANQAFGQVGNASGQAVKGMQNALGGLGK